MVNYVYETCTHNNSKTILKIKLFFFLDFQTIGSRVDGSSLGKDATRLRKVLEAFPRYMNSVIISPDVKSCETQEEARNLKNFIVESGSSLSALTYQA